MSKLGQLLNELVNEVALTSDVHACINKYERKIRGAVREELAKPYRLLACQDSGYHMNDVDDQGRCIFCGEFG